MEERMEEPYIEEVATHAGPEFMGKVPRAPADGIPL
jgi:hypothetical protein